MKKITLLLLLTLLSLCVQAKDKIQQFTLKSPNGKLVTHIVATPEQEITYDIVYDGVTLMLPSHLGLNRVYEKMVTAQMPVVGTSTNTVDEMVSSPFTRQSSMRNHYNKSL